MQITLFVLLGVGKNTKDIVLCMCNFDFQVLYQVSLWDCVY